jgi:hypothetical protein
VKEARFFLDQDYPLPSAARFNGSNLVEYEKFFAHCSTPKSSVRVEASPDYLYSRLALEIADILPNAKIVFVLREPVERMISWYRYAKQRNLVAPETSFERYVLMQLDRRIEPTTPTFLRALDQCRYARYVPRFQRAFGSRCIVIPFEKLVSDPLSVMSDLASAAGLDAAFYRSYDFHLQNASGGMRNGRLSSAYVALRRTVVLRLHGSPRAMRVLRWPNRAVKRLLLRNVARPEEIAVPDQLRNLILEQSAAAGDIAPAMK